MRVCGKAKKNGQPCRYVLGTRKKGCPHHTLGKDGKPKARLFQQKGALAAKLRHALPEAYEVPDLRTREGRQAAAQLLFELALKRNIERWRLSEGRGALDQAQKEQGIEAQQQLVDALLKIEHGGAAMLLLTRLQDGLSEGRRRPLPGRVLPLTEQTPL